jgi:twitching motility protein PilT
MAQGCSDIHLAVGVPPMLRLHGDLMPIKFRDLGDQELEGYVEEILSESQKDRFRRREDIDFSYVSGDGGRFRVNVYHKATGVGATFRNIPSVIPSLDSLGLPSVIQKFCDLHQGMVLVTGSTGTGKSTTLAAMIDEINEVREEHIMTIEDPIEFLHRHKKCMVNQREVGADTKSFNRALKSVLRQDPDVILVGEMRDTETMATALTAAETGHLVFATLHTQDAPQTIDRIIDVFPPHQQEQIRVQLSTTLMGVCTQQLLPTRDGRGRVVACELLIPTPAVRNLVREGKTHQIYSVMQTGTQYGMVTMDAALADLVRRGMISRELAQRRSSTPEELGRLLGAAGAARVG